MARDFALVVVDVERSVEDYLLDHERGYMLDLPAFKWERSREKLYPSISPPRGCGRSLRAGFNNIVQTVRKAYLLEVPIIALEYDQKRGNEQHRLCPSLEPYVPPRARIGKATSSAYQSGDFAGVVERAGYRRHLIVGFDRDVCVHQTARDARELGYEVWTSPSCLITSTQDHQDFFGTPEQKWLAANTHQLAELEDVWNLVVSWSQERPRSVL